MVRTGDGRGLSMLDMGSVETIVIGLRLDTKEGTNFGKSVKLVKGNFIERL